jgi:hypothetical protein
MSWREVGVGNTIRINLLEGTSQFYGGTWWHKQVGTGKVFRFVGVGDDCPAGCSYHSVDGVDQCVNEQGDPCGSQAPAKTASEFLDCGRATPVFQNGQWGCPQAPGCAPGQVRNAQGQCVSAAYKEPTNIHRCLSTENWNPTTKQCQQLPLKDSDCADNELVDSVTGKCAPICGDDTRSKGGCQQPPTPPKVIPPSPNPAPPLPVKPPALSTPSNVMPWLIGLAALAGVGYLAYEANKGKGKGKSPAPGRRR